MCGIAGYIRVTPAADNVAAGSKIVRLMSEAIAHRGPDGHGFWGDEYAALGHRRLSIVDLAGGHQPMTSEQGRLWITYNGEIFNHADIRRDLEKAGHRYQSRCDTETILHAYEEYGPACVERFRGMFAFVLWDQDRRTVFAARDRLGIKPFYYFWDGQIFVFASEIKALLAHPEISPKLNDSLLNEYLAFGYSSGEETMFAGIRKLMPGHHLTLSLGPGESSAPAPRRVKYWDLPGPSAGPGQSEEEWIRECRNRLEETVRMRLMSDVPLGVFLSGGVDSSAIASLMTRMVDSKVKTFSVGYAEERYSELSYAQTVAQHLGTDHREVRIGEDEFWGALPKLIWHEDEPIAWPSSVSLYFVSRLAAQDVKVVLTGEGSDELFAGYERYRHYLLNRRALAVYGQLPAMLRQGVRNWIQHSSLLKADMRRKLGHTFLGRPDTLSSLHLDNFYCAFSEQEQAHLWRGGLAAAGPIYQHFESYWNAAPDSSTLGRMLYADQKTYLVELLMKQDQMSMATSIESRVPFLDHPFVEFSCRVPAGLKTRGRVGKYILKRAVEDLLPKEIVYRTKMGFPTPLRQWLKGESARGIYGYLTASDGLLGRYVDLDKVRDLMESHAADREDQTDRLWRLLNLQLWGDWYFTGQRQRAQEWAADRVVAR